MRIDRVNRALWTVLGLLLLAGGVCGAIASLGQLPGTEESSPLLWSWAVTRWRDAGAAAPLVVAAIGLLGVLAGLFLLRAQLRISRSSVEDLRLDEGPAAGGPGSTRVRGGALAGALTEDMRAIREVQAAHVTLAGPPEALRVSARLDVLPGANLGDLAADVQTCLDRFTATTGTTVCDVDVTLRLREREATRVN